MLIRICDATALPTWACIQDIARDEGSDQAPGGKGSVVIQYVVPVAFPLMGRITIDPHWGQPGPLFNCTSRRNWWWRRTPPSRLASSDEQSAAQRRSGVNRLGAAAPIDALVHSLHSTTPTCSERLTDWSSRPSRSIRNFRESRHASSF